MEEIDRLKSVVDYTEMPLAGPIYDGLYGRLMLEVRQFDGRSDRTFVIRTMLDGKPHTTMVSWDVFTDALDSMRARMMSGDWDEALSRLTGGTDFD